MRSNAEGRKVVIFVAAVIAAAWLWMFSFKLGFRPPEWTAIMVLMWIPGLVSIAFRLLFREGFGDVGWNVGKGRFWLWAYIGPVALASLSILLALLFRKATLASDLRDQAMLDALFFKLPWPAPTSSNAFKKYLPFAASCTTGSRPPKSGQRLFRKTAGARSSANTQELTDVQFRGQAAYVRTDITGGGQPIKT